jgi:hypothetical protein
MRLSRVRGFWRGIAGAVVLARLSRVRRRRGIARALVPGLLTGIGSSVAGRER